MNLAESFLLFLIILLSFVHIRSSFVPSEVGEFYQDERKALLEIRDRLNSSINLHGRWTGPPCLGNDSRWVGVNCSNWHIIGLVLEGVQLTGTLPPEFLQNITLLSTLSFRNNSLSGQLPNLTTLQHLSYVSFAENHFSGWIPAGYIELPELSILELQENALVGNIPLFDQDTLTGFNVSYNNLAGQIPETKALQKFAASSFDHNPNLCGNQLGIACPPVAPSYPPEAPVPIPSNQNQKKLQVSDIILIALVAALVPFLVIVCCFCYYKTHRKEASSDGEQAARIDSGDWVKKKMPRLNRADDPARGRELEFFDRNLPSFELDELLRSSAEVLSKDEVGTRYKTILESGPVVAVKRLKDLSDLSRKEYAQQMQLLGKLRHENLAHIISFYYSKDEKLIIHEHIPRGNLFELLHENRGVGRVPLNWAKRLSIIRDVARGLAFLHQSLPSHKVLHANLKSSNVLIYLDSESYHAKLSDFGLLPLFTTRKSTERLAIKRTPEFFEGKKLTQKADVYCLGILMLEAITGRNPDIVSGDSNGRTNALSNWARNVVDMDWSIDVLDVEIRATTEGHDEMLSLTRIALDCTDVVPEKRPMMSEVLNRIEEIGQGSRENDNSFEENRES